LAGLGGAGGSGGGGGSIIDSSAIAVLTEVSGILSPDAPYNGEIIIIAVPPPLSIIAGGANVVLTWPTNSSGYTLQSATNLGSSVIWTTNSIAPVVVNGLNTVTNPMSSAQQFFRLIQ